MKLEHSLTSYKITNSNWINDLNISPYYINLCDIDVDTQRKTGRTLFDINHSSILFDPSPRIMTIK